MLTLKYIYFQNCNPKVFFIHFKAPAKKVFLKKKLVTVTFHLSLKLRKLSKTNNKMNALQIIYRVLLHYF